MALIQCSECQMQVSTKATTCPHCGAPVPEILDDAVSPEFQSAETPTETRIETTDVHEIDLGQLGFRPVHIGLGLLGTGIICVIAVPQVLMAEKSAVVVESLTYFLCVISLWWGLFARAGGFPMWSPAGEIAVGVGVLFYVSCMWHTVSSIPRELVARGGAFFGWCLLGATFGFIPYLAGRLLHRVGSPNGRNPSSEDWMD